MIRIKFFFTDEFLSAFKINGHGPEYVCSAVSILAINTINCIEKFTDDKFLCDYNKDGGMIDFKFADDKSVSHDSKILMAALEFGLRNVCEEYEKFVCISEVKL